MTTAKKWILAGVLAALAGAGGWLYFRSPAKPAYVTAKLDRGDIDSSVSTSGTLNAVITVQVGSQVSGNILALYADFNTKVKKGQLVAQIDPAPFQASVDQATASLNAAKAAVGTADATLTKSKADLVTADANLAKSGSAVDLSKVLDGRRQTMFTDGIGSREDADNSKAVLDQANAAENAARAARDSATQQIDVALHELEQAKAMVQQGQAVLSQAQLNLSHTRILAPVDGTVESRNMDVGQTVAASFQAPVIFLIAQDLTKMQVDTNVDESDVGRVQLNNPVTFTVDAWPGRVFRGSVSQIRQAPINVQNVITYDVVVQAGNADLKLFPGMTANVTIAVAHVPNALRLPKAALRFRAAGSKQQPQSVSILGSDGVLRQVPLKTGISDSNYIEIVGGGLTEGQLVVTGNATKAGAAAPAGKSAGGPGRIGL